MKSETLRRIRDGTIQNNITVEEEFNCKWNETELLESDEAISRKEIASRLNINADSIIHIELL